MCQCCDFIFTEEMLNYYKQNIESNDPIITLSALNVFKAILKNKVEAHGKGTSNILLSKYLFEKNVLKKFD